VPTPGGVLSAAPPREAPPVTTTPGRARSPWHWVPSAYLAEGIPFAMVIWVAGTMFKNLGHSDSQITLATASIGIAWSLKPLWAAFLDMYRTKRFIVLCMEVLMAVLLATVALCLPLPNYFQLTIALLWVLAFASATQDICVDGIYITTLGKRQQAAFIGVQGVFWNMGRLFGTALIVWTAGTLQQDHQLSATTAWAWAIGVSAAAMAALALVHGAVLPAGALTRRPQGVAEVGRTFVDAVVDFFRKPQIWGMLLFVFFYRSSEGLLLIEGPLFMQAAPDAGGLGLTLKEKGLIDGTVSTVVSLAGGLLGGAFLARYGLNRRTLVFMALCLNLPHITYVVLSQLAGPGQALSLWTVAALVTAEKFGYSFGFVANMLYMMQQVSPGRYHMTHYAFCTALMNLMLVPTQALSGPLADHLGYRAYFILVMFAAIPSVLAAAFAPFTHPPADDRQD